MALARFPRVRLIVLFAVAVMPLWTACSENSVWGESTESVASLLQSGNHEFLRHIDYDRIRVSDVDHLGPGAAYYLAIVYRSLGMDRVAAELADREQRRGTAEWDRRSGELLASMQLENESYRDAAETARRIGERFPEDDGPRRLHARALYELERYEALLELFDELDPDGRGIAASLEGRTGDEPSFLSDEMLLYRLVAARELGRPNWQKEFLQFFRNRPARDVHGRLALYVSYRRNVAAEFSATDRVLFEARRLLAAGDVRGGYETFVAYLEQGDAVVTESVSADVARAALGAGELRSAAGLLSQLVEEDSTREDPVYEDSIRRRLLFDAGRLYRWAGDVSLAARVLSQSLAYAEDGAFQRTLWYYLNSVVRSDPDGAVDELARYAKRFDEPAYFADLYEELIGALAERQRWELLWLLYQATEDHISPGTAAQLQVLLSHLIADGLIPVAAGREADLSRELLLRAAEQTDSLFYYLVATAALGREPDLLSAGDADSAENRDDETGSDPLVEFIHGYFAFGLPEYAYREAVARAGELSPDSLVEIGDRLARRGFVTEGLRLHTRAARRMTAPVTEDMARRIYPRGFHQTVREAAELHGIPISVLFALIREESFFDPDVVSHAGAIGLAQLMPETAADMAQRMRMAEEPRLTDAVTNIQIGAYYLANLSERFTPVSRALAAYNGGQGRVRRWQANRGDLGSFLFFEAIPFVETRGYVRKVLVSAVYYGYVYEQISSDSTVRGFFPDLHSVNQE